MVVSRDEEFCLRCDSNIVVVPDVFSQRSLDFLTRLSVFKLITCRPQSLQARPMDQKLRAAQPPSVHRHVRINTCRRTKLRQSPRGAPCSGTKVQDHAPRSTPTPHKGKPLKLTASSSFPCSRDQPTSQTLDQAPVHRTIPNRQGQQLKHASPIGCESAFLRQRR